MSGRGRSRGGGRTAELFQGRRAGDRPSVEPQGRVAPQSRRVKGNRLAPRPRPGPDANGEPHAPVTVPPAPPLPVGQPMCRRRRRRRPRPPGPPPLRPPRPPSPRRRRRRRRPFLHPDAPGALGARRPDSQAPGPRAPKGRARAAPRPPAADTGEARVIPCLPPSRGGGARRGGRSAVTARRRRPGARTGDG